MGLAELTRLSVNVVGYGWAIVIVLVGAVVVAFLDGIGLGTPWIFGVGIATGMGAEGMRRLTDVVD